MPSHCGLNSLSLFYLIHPLGNEDQYLVRVTKLAKEFGDNRDCVLNLKSLKLYANIEKLYSEGYILLSLKFHITKHFHPLECLPVRTSC